MHCSKHIFRVEPTENRFESNSSWNRCDLDLVELAKKRDTCRNRHFQNRWFSSGIPLNIAENQISTTSEVISASPRNSQNNFSIHTFFYWNPLNIQVHRIQFKIIWIWPRTSRKNTTKIKKHAIFKTPFFLLESTENQSESNSIQNRLILIQS